MPSQALIPGTIAQSAGGVSWSNLNNAKVEDGVVATTGTIGPGGGGGSANQLLATNLGFNLPTGAVIDGIKLEAKVNSSGGSTDTARISLLYNGGSTTPANTPGIGQNWFGGLKWNTYGGPTSLWGRTWTAADINHTNFGASLSTQLNAGTGTATIDAILITVYYHLGGSTTPADVPIREVYKVYSQSGTYLGLMPQPTDALKIPQDVNSAGSQISITVPVSADTSALDTEIYTTEDGSANYTTEDGADNYTTEGQIPIVSTGLQSIDTLIKNGNTVQAWLYNYWYPNGKCMFIGKIRRWEATFGGADGNDNAVKVLLYSSGYDLDNYVARGAPFVYTADVTQSVWNTGLYLQTNYGGIGLVTKYGQTVKVVSAPNLGAITLMVYGTADLTVNVWTQPNGGTLLASTTQRVDVVTQTAIQFGFPALAAVVAGQTVFYEAVVANNQSLYIYQQNTDVYANGTAYQSSYAGGSGGGAYIPIVGDLYFITGSGTPSTTVTFTSKDPSTGMLAPLISDYNLRGGTQKWTAESIDATGLSLTYKFSVQTLYEALNAVLDLSPNGFYYYVDLGTQTIYFKNQSTTADFLVQKGVHINDLTLAFTTEGSINTELFTGGDIGGGVNLYKIFTNPSSIAAFGPLLERKTDNRVTLDATANAIGNSKIAELSGEQQQTVITLVHTTKLDLTLLTPGKVIGFRGFGTFVDSILVQIVHRDWAAETVNLQLGLLPTRLSTEYNQTIRELIASQTLDNPGTPT